MVTSRDELIDWMISHGRAVNMGESVLLRARVNDVVLTTIELINKNGRTMQMDVRQKIKEGPYFVTCELVRDTLEFLVKIGFLKTTFDGDIT